MVEHGLYRVKNAEKNWRCNLASGCTKKRKFIIFGFLLWRDCFFGIVPEDSICGIVFNTCQTSFLSPYLVGTQEYPIGTMPNGAYVTNKMEVNIWMWEDAKASRDSYKSSLVLSQPVNSSSIEWSWSTYSSITLKETSFNTKRVDKLFFIHSNLMRVPIWHNRTVKGPKTKIPENIQPLLMWAVYYKDCKIVKGKEQCKSYPKELTLEAFPTLQ